MSNFKFGGYKNREEKKAKLITFSEAQNKPGIYLDEQRENSKLIVFPSNFGPNAMVYIPSNGDIRTVQKNDFALSSSTLIECSDVDVEIYLSCD